ncbi:gustatory and odorant receptor 22 [Tribolium castaneum]|uniref:Gustatory receptor n=1 Tax=Tribolium castaneum TaxID=7070 RepID=A2AX72_TRICA|nr:PREDICTED: gustatory and odorant receptor 22-like [Tribolium castaneum]CAL23143.2 gustatory receptor candidate 10 [Tribolium castaneum]CAL23172.3 gustatory receptor candidate 39 [Tribolium castaneum]|eukprot:XP_015837537.1 PREDICTED: gustatory and odorant receptor 22-like [Tribolium castaneum]
MRNDHGSNTHLHPDDAIRRAKIVKVAASPTSANPDEEPDPELLDRYDNFYQTTKSLLVLFQIMGVMPIERSGKGRTTFRWLSSTSIYAYFIFGAETIFVTMVFKERLYLILRPGKRFDEYIYGIIFLSILIPHFLLPVAAWTNGTEVAKFKNMWTRFQLKYYQVTGTPIIFHNLTLITYSLCVISWAVGIGIMLAQYYLQADMLLWHTFGYYHILAMLNCLCSLWFINCTAKGRVAVWMCNNLHKALESRNPAKILGAYRDLWVDLSHMMQQLGKAYSGMYSMYCLLILLTTIVASYGSVTEIMDQGISFKEAGLFMIAFYCMTLLYIICNEGHHATRKMGPEFRERLLNVNLSAVDQKTRQEVHMFLMAIEKNPPIMNLNGYANVNRKLISSTVTSIATYLVMLMQFRLTLMRNAQLAARRAIANVSVSSGNTTMS